MTALLYETIHGVRFDESQRLKEIVEQICARKESSITGQGHILAMNLASSRMGPTAWLTHSFAGLQGIRYLKALRDDMAEPAQARGIISSIFCVYTEQVCDSSRQFLLIGEPETGADMLDALNRQWRGESGQTESRAVPESGSRGGFAGPGLPPPG